MILLNRNVLIISDRLGLRNFGHSNFITWKSNGDLSSCRDAVMVTLNLIVWERSHRMGWIINTMELVFKVLMSICKMRLVWLSRWVRLSEQLSIWLLSPLWVSQTVIFDLFCIYIGLYRTIFIDDLSEMHHVGLALLFLVFYRPCATLFNFIILLRELSIDRASLHIQQKKVPYLICRSVHYCSYWIRNEMIRRLYRSPSYHQPHCFQS
jgi:phosphatidylglycerophosphate synthase